MSNINFHDPNELTEYEKQVLKEAEEMPEPTGKHIDIVNAKMKQDELRIRNGLKAKHSQLDLLRKLAEAAALDIEDEDHKPAHT